MASAPVRVRDERSTRCSWDQELALLEKLAVELACQFPAERHAGYDECQAIECHSFEASWGLCSRP